MAARGKGTTTTASSPEIAHANRIVTEIKRSEEGTSDSVPNVVVSSWKRCVDDHKLDRSPYRGPEVVSQQEYQNAAEPLDLLVHVAKPEIERLLAKVAPSHYVVMLSDPSGVALDVLSSTPPDKALRRVGVCRGAAWAERHAGTNGIGTSIASRSPVTVHRTQHFFFDYSNLTCTAAPIFDTAGNVIAALDTSSVKDLSQEMQPLVLEVVAAAARQIERCYFLARHRDNPILRIEWRLDDVQAGNGLMLALDDNGCAIDILGKNGSDGDVNAPNAIVGKPLHEFMDVSWQDVAREDNDTRIERIGIARLKDDDHPCFASLMPSERRIGAKSSYCSMKRRAPGKTGRIGDVRLDLDRLAGSDPIMLGHVKMVRKIADKRLPILLQGESGTGKEEFARGIHDTGPRASGPFIVIDCSSIPEGLIESELFGYEAGTFTGARRSGRRGRIAEADGGTLFLDEIGDMPLPLQTRLLRALAQGEVVPLGAAKAMKVDFSVVCASHQDLSRMVSEGTFRQDLYYRIAGLRLVLPPLRERADREEVILGACELEATQLRLDSSPHITPLALRILSAQRWPGNMRELRHAVQYALAITETDTIDADHLPDWLEFDTCEGSGAGEPMPDLIDVLERHQWCISDAASELKVSRQTLYRWIKKQALDRPA
jgi:sigma-54 dependent transcriptional regulator, acetoin dehydrogenase operon transcriptional activator AcoR